MKRLLLVELGFRNYKEHIVESLAKVPDIELVIATGLRRIIDPSWAERYATGFVDFSYAAGDLQSAVDRYCKTWGIQFDGVLTYVEPSVAHTNRLAHHLGLPPISQRTDNAIRNKRLVREVLRKKGVPQVPFHVFETEADVARFLADKPRFPLIVKPSEMTASLGVVLVRNEAELAEAVKKARDADFWDENLRDLYGDISTDVLAEEYIDGPEYSVETFVCGGVPKIIGVTKKWTGSDGFFAEQGHCFPAPDLDGEITQRIATLTDQVHRALEIANAITHLEVRIRDDVPHLIELNCRLGGDYISELLQRSTDESIGVLLASAALGRSRDTDFSSKRYQSVFFPNTKREGRVTAIHRENIPATHSVELHATEGEVIFRDGLVGETRLAAVFTDGAPDTTIDLEAAFEIQPPLAVVPLPTENDKLLVFGTLPRDLPELIAIEDAAWSLEQRATPETLATRLAQHPEEHFLGYSVKQRRYVGAISAVPVAKGRSGNGEPWTHFAELAKLPFAEREPAEALYIVSLSAIPEAPRGTGSALVGAVADECERKGIRFLRYGIRVPRYADFAARGMSFDEYYRKLLDGGVHEDMFKVARNAGGRAIRPLPNYFSDPPSRNYGILIEHRTESEKP